MSRVGQSPIYLSDTVDISQAGKLLKAKGPLGELELQISDNINVQVEDKTVKILNNDESQKGRAIWGTTRSLIYNMVKGVSEGFVKNLEIVGVGYRGALNGRKLSLSLGLSHSVELDVPDGKIIIKRSG